MNSRITRKRTSQYLECPHCGVELSTKRFKEHEGQYFNHATKAWLKKNSLETPQLYTAEAESVSGSDFSVIEEAPKLSSEEPLQCELEDFTKTDDAKLRSRDNGSMAFQTGQLFFQFYYFTFIP